MPLPARPRADRQRGGRQAGEDAAATLEVLYDWRKLMKARSARSEGAGDVSDIRSILEGSPDLDTAAELLNLAGNSTRLKLLYLLENAKEMCVCDLAEMLGVSVSAVSQHLAKLRAYQLVAPRRDAQTIYYRLTDHKFNDKLRKNFFH